MLRTWVPTAKRGVRSPSRPPRQSQAWIEVRDLDDPSVPEAHGGFGRWLPVGDKAVALQHASFEKPGACFPAEVKNLHPVVKPGVLAVGQSDIAIRLVLRVHD